MTNRSPARPSFATTRWSLVHQAVAESREAQAALAELCQIYWPPLYAYARRQGQPEADAQDSTQSFFAHLLARNVLAKADPNRGRFRSFLLTCLQNHLRIQHDRQQAFKRSGNDKDLSFDFAWAEREYRTEPTHEVTAEQIFERRWALTLLDRVMQLLREKYVAKGKEEWFDTLQAFLAGVNATDQSLAEAASRLGLTSGAMRVALHRLRAHYRDLLRAEIAATLSLDEDIDQELRELTRALRM